MALKGIDVSEHQGVIDWNKVKAAGIDFAILRAGYGRNNIDKQFKRNISECNRLGIPVGVYWFSYAYNHDMAVREAEYCMAAVKGYKLIWPVFFDFEYDSVDYAKRCGINATPALACDMALAFMERIKKGGYTAGWYANPDYIRRYFTGAALNAYPLWIAQYASRYTYSGKAEVAIWQYSSSGKVSGVSGNCDMNHGYKDYRKQEVKPVAKEPWYIKDGTWAKAKELGLMDGRRPTENITRSEVAAVAVRLYKLIKEGNK